MTVTTLSEDEGPGTTAEGVRRALDICLVCLAMLFLGPLSLLVAAAVWLESGGPILFCQVRIGKGGKYFWMYKFRKFHADAGSAGSPLTLKKDPRLTFVGSILAATKLDELPQC
jgi:lipopolysaccharide/colanic/teichoic acid biosynthesis glycosyltransferase